MADTYRTMKYVGVTPAQMDQIKSEVDAFSTSNRVTVYGFESNATDIRINAGGPNAHGYMIALRNRIAVQLGIPPSEDVAQVDADNARVRTKEDVGRIGRGGNPHNF